MKENSPENEVDLLNISESKEEIIAQPRILMFNATET